MQCLGSSPGSSDQFRVTHLLPHLQQQSKPKFLLLFLKRRLHAMLPRGTWQKDGLKGSLPSRVALPSRAPARLYYCASARAHLLPHLLEQPNPKFCFFSKKKAACNASPTWHVDLNIVHGSIYHIDTRNMTFFFFFFKSQPFTFEMLGINHLQILLSDVSDRKKAKKKRSFCILRMFAKSS